MVLSTKVEKNINKPAKALHKTSFGASTPSRKAYRSIVNGTAKKSYRADLRSEAIARASAVKQSQKQKKELKRETKLRGSRKRKAEAASESS